MRGFSQDERLMLSNPVGTWYEGEEARRLSLVLDELVQRGLAVRCRYGHNARTELGMIATRLVQLGAV